MRTQLLKQVVALLVVSAFFSTAGFCQNIKGNVIDSKTKNALSSVLITEEGGTGQVTTDASGNFTFLPGTTGIPVYRQPAAYQSLTGAMLSRAGVTVYAADGKMVLSGQGQVVLTAGTAGLPDGVYLVSIKADGFQYLERIVKAGAFINTTSPKNIPVTGQPTGLAKALAEPQPIIMEAENMTLNGYTIDTGSKLNSTAITLVPDTGNDLLPVTGTATGNFNGPAGNYTVTLSAIPENDGTPQVKLSINGNQIISEILPKDDSYHTYAKRMDYAVQNVALNTGDVITITGTSDSNAYARVDKVIFASGDLVTLSFTKTGYNRKTVNVLLGQTNLVVEMDPVPSFGGKPGPYNTGPKGTLTLFSGTITAGAMIENVYFNGGITITADNVTIRNFRIDTKGGWYGVKCTDQKGLVLEDGEVFGSASACIYGNNFTARRLNVHDAGTDAFKTGSNSLIEACWIHHLGTNPDAHADGNQTKGGSNITIRGNNFDMPKGVAGYKSNSANIIEAQHSDIINVVIENNWMNGGNYTVYFSANPKYMNGTLVTKDCKLINNRFGRDYGYGPLTTKGAVINLQVSGNVWDDTGELMDINR